MKSADQGSAPESLPPPSSLQIASRQNLPPPAQPRVIVTDIQMSFGSMVVFMVKWALAAIPAFIILASIFFILWALFAIFGLGLMWHISSLH